LRNIRDIVLNIKSKYQTTNPFEIIESEGLVLQKIELHKSIKGFFQLYEDIGIIYINNLSDKREQLITAAHELGHYFLHGNSEIFYLRNNSLNLPSKYELEANVFAAEFLVDDYVFDEYRDYNINQLASISGVPYDFVSLKYKNLFL